MLGRHWEHGQATIVAREVAQKGTDRYHVAYDYIADVTPESGVSPPFRAVFKERFYGGECHEPAVGEQARVRYRGEGEHVEFDRDALRAVLDTEESARREKFDATARAAPGTPPTASPAAPRPIASESAPPPLDETMEILNAILRAKAAGDQAEVDRLKARMAQLSGQHPPP